MPRQGQPKLSSLENHPPNTADVKIPQHHVEVIVASYRFILFVEERTQTVRFANEAGERKAITTVAIKRFVMKIVTGLNGT